MRILAIDTSGQQAGAAIVDNYITIGEIQLNARTGEKSWTHSEILMPGIHQMFKLTGLQLHDIDYVAYTAGPGSFTGLRIGASCALGLAHGLNKPTIAVPTLDALAYNIAGAGGLIVPMMDARRGQVYFAAYSAAHERITDYAAMPVGDAMAIVAEKCAGEQVIFLGDGADAYRDEIVADNPRVKFAKPNMNRQRASSAGVWALNHIKNGGVGDTKVEILYVRSPQAVRQKQGLA